MTSKIIDQGSPPGTPRKSVESVRQDEYPEPVQVKGIRQNHHEIYEEALRRYPNDDAIDSEAERKLVRKLDMRILPLLGICYFFYYVDKTTL
jgi:hypothetical protein